MENSTKKEKKESGMNNFSEKVFGARSSENPESKKDLLQKYYVNNDIQNRCIKLFFEAIKTNIQDSEDELVASVSSSIVSSIVSIGKLNDSKFIRSKILNLKNRSNLDLAKDVYAGKILPNDFVKMTLEEMKSKELKKMEDDIHQKCLLKIQLADNIQQTTDMFECFKCKQRKCSYFQLQTRSADEPMTTYVRCVCGNKWKFS